MMKRCALCLLLVLIMVPVAQAARAPVQDLAQDPYASALLIEAGSGTVLFEANADARLYPASMLKLMNLYVILQRIEQGALKTDEMVQVTAEAANTGGSQVYLDSKEQFSVEELLYAMTIQSANDAAVALATHIAGSKEGFVALMNQKAGELGMNNTTFHSVHGLPPASGQQPDVTTARDMAILCRALAGQPEALKYTATRSRGFRDGTFMMRNHNKLLDKVVGCDGFKTGYYRAAGFSIAATAQRNNVRIIAVVMGCKDSKVRDAKTIELLNKGFAAIQPKPEPPGSGALPQPDVVTQPKPDTGTGPITFATSVVDGPSGAPATETMLSTQPNTVAADNSGWGKFFIGLGIGFLLFLALFGTVAVLIKRRSGRTSLRYRRQK
jgi:D-alanyl-D-alanine carboxypeptidase